MQHGGGVVGVELHQLALGVAVGDPVVGRPGSQLARGAVGEDAPVLDDRHAVGELLGLLEVVGRQHDRLAELPQRADRVPRRTAGLGVEAGGGLVEEDQLRVAHQRDREVQASKLAAAEAPRARVGLLCQPRQLEHLRHAAEGGGTGPAQYSSASRGVMWG